MNLQDLELALRQRKRGALKERSIAAVVALVLFGGIGWLVWRYVI